MDILHTPEGVRDLYGNEGLKKQRMESCINEVMLSNGYRPITTPSFEYFDIFNKERGTVPSKEMFKFFDRDGNTLVLRPDMTPSIARSVAKYYRDRTFPIRLTYSGKTFINNSNYQGRLKETNQIGAELVNDGSVLADAEMIALTVKSLLAAGLKEFQVEIGHAGFFKGLLLDNSIDEETGENLRVAIKTKNHFALKDILDGLSLPEEQKQLFLRLPEMFGSFRTISSFKEFTGNETALSVLNRLEELNSLLSEYGVLPYVSYDLGMLSKYNYYTGIIFRALTIGTGEMIASGGRYDNLVSQFGMDAPAIGMSITLDYLMTALFRQGILPEEEKEVVMVMYPESRIADAVSYAEMLRKNGTPAALCPLADTAELTQLITELPAYVKEAHALKEDGQTAIYRR